MIKHLRALGFFSTLAGVFLGRLFPVWNSHIVGGLQDTRLFLWNSWWFDHAIRVLHTSPYHTGMLFHPFGARLVSHDFPLWMNLVTWAGQSSGMTLAGASNLWFALSWILAGFCVYGLVREALRSETIDSDIPAILAGIYAMTHSYTLARAMQNWGQFNFYAIALFLWSLLRARRKGSARAYLLSGLALAWTAACHYYFFIYALVLWAVIAALDLLPYRLHLSRRHPSPLSGRILWNMSTLAGLVAVYIMLKPGNLAVGPFVIGLHGPENALFVMWMAFLVWVLSHVRLSSSPNAVIGDPSALKSRDPGLQHAGMTAKRHMLLIVTALLLLSPLFWETFKLIQEGGYPRQSILWKTHLPGANLLALLSPNALQAFWGEAVSGWFTARGMNPQEQAASIGWVCMGVVALCLSSPAGAGRGSMDSPPETAGNDKMKKWGILAVASTVLAMGAHLHIAQHNTWLPMPFFFVRLLPGLGNVRVPERWMALGVVAWAVVLAFALIRLHRDRGWSLRASGIIVGGLLLIENWPGVPFRPLPPVSPVYERLRALPDGAVLALPFYAGDSSIGTGSAIGEEWIFPWDHLWAQTQHHKPIVGGYIGRISRRVIERYQGDPYLKSVIDLEERAIADKEDEPGFGLYAIPHLQFRYVLAYDKAVEPSALRYALKSLPLELLENQDGVRLYRVVP